MKSRTGSAIGITALALAAGLGYGIRAFASGIPSANALSYAGVLEDATGPVTASHNIQLFLYDAAVAGNILCQTTTAAVGVVNGHFSVQLPNTCTTAVGANPNVWVDVLVDGSDTGRTAIGAVPYAVEANHTPNADNATTAGTANAAGGALQQQIVPSGAVMAFNLGACPAGWSTYAAAGGRTIIGVNPAGGNSLSQRKLGDTPGEETHTQAVSEMPAHAHSLFLNGAAPVPNPVTGGYWGFNWASAGIYESVPATDPQIAGGAQNFMTAEPTGGGAPFNQMQPSLALLYCQKN